MMQVKQMVEGENRYEEDVRAEVVQWCCIRTLSLAKEAGRKRLTGWIGLPWCYPVAPCAAQAPLPPEKIMADIRHDARICAQRSSGGHAH
jgi:hypothetical protein